MPLPYILNIAALIDGDNISSLLTTGIVLVTLVIIINIYLIVKMNSNKTTNTESETPQITSESRQIIAAETSSDTELIAVITAAIATYLNDSTSDTTSSIAPNTKFRVVSFKKVR